MSAEPKQEKPEVAEPTDVSNVEQEEPELPPFTFANVSKDILYGLKSLVDNPDFSPLVIIPLLVAESVVNQLILTNVPYTEIDYSTYMQQIDIIEKGELHYSAIAGDTGPIVYPGGYVWIYSWMKFFTDGMNHLHNGQEVFRFLYLFTQLFTFLCYMFTDAGIPPYVLYLLCLSKRMHSIYVLRLFNDAFTTFFAISSVMVLQIAAKVKRSKASWFWPFMLSFLAADLLAVAISVKMNALLYLPGFAVITYFLCDENAIKTLCVVLFGVLVELGMNYPFLFSEDPTVVQDFLAGAFNFSRQFLYEWTVNWRFVPEEIFLSKTFQTGLLVGLVSTLLLFLFTRWISQSVTGKPVSQFLKDAVFRFYKNTIAPDNVIFGKNSPDFVFWVMTLSNVIGVTFSRSLHYQFLCWYFYSMPYLLFKTGFPIPVVVALFAAHEWSWDVFPSTVVSSVTLVSVLALTVARNYEKGL